jgi:tetratricopeptide (TPR) repeat protein
VERQWGPGKQELLARYAYLMVGDIAAAKQANQYMLARLQQVAPAPLPAEAHQQAAVLLAQGQFQAVIDLLELYTVTDPSLLRILATAYVKREVWGKTVSTLRTAVLLSEPAPGEWTKVANAQLMTGRMSSSGYCRLALAQEAKDPAAYTIQGIEAIMQEAPLQAVSHFINALQTDITHSAARHNLEQLAGQQNMGLSDYLQQAAQGFLAKSDFTRAAETLSVCLELFPDNVAPYKLLAVVLQEPGHENDALQLWQTATLMENQPGTQVVA